MTRSYREFTYTAPLREPLENDAFIAEAKGEWRVVVFPGTPCRKLLFHRFLVHAPEGLEVVVISRPGFGRGHKRAYPDWDDQIAAAKPFFTGKKVVTMGVSYGGELALKAALDYPEDVKGVVTVAALITEPRSYMRELEKIGDAAPVNGLLAEQTKRVKAEIAGRRARIGPLLERLGGLDCPVAVLHGDLDTLVSRSNARALLERFPSGANVVYEEIPAGTHYLELQTPRRIHAAIGRIIARVEAQNGRPDAGLRK